MVSDKLDNLEKEFYMSEKKLVRIARGKRIVDIGLRPYSWTV
jgi:hypothetical protein